MGPCTWRHTAPRRARRVGTSQTTISLYVLWLPCCAHTGCPDLRGDTGPRCESYGDHRRSIEDSRKANMLCRRTRLRPSSEHSYTARALVHCAKRCAVYSVGFSQRLAHARVLNRNTSAIVSSSLSSPSAPSTPSPSALPLRSLEVAFPLAPADIAMDNFNRARRGHSPTYPMTPPTNHPLHSGVFTSSAPIAPVRLRMCLPPPFPSCRPHELPSTAIPKATVPSLPRRSPSSRHHPHHEHCLGAVPMCA